MKVVILAGGLGTRLAEETRVRPKPMVEIGGRPILWHIMKHYASYGFKEFYIALGYKGNDIKRYFLDQYNLSGSMKIDFANQDIIVYNREYEDWAIHFMETGLYTNTGGRVKRLQKHLQDEPFMVTYGDGVSNIDLKALESFHKNHGRIATVTAVRPPARFGGLLFNGDLVTDFTEKPQIGEGWINGGFLVLNPEVFEYLIDDKSSLESNALENLADDGELVAYKHGDFWQCMDTLRDKRFLESLWQEGKAPWKVWHE